MSERITEAKLREMVAATEEAESYGGYDHGVDPRDLVAEIWRLRALIVRGVEAEKDTMHPGAIEAWASLEIEAEAIKKESA